MPPEEFLKRLSEVDEPSSWNMEEEMRLLITGGTGLVGSNVIKIAQEKYPVEVVASLYSRSPAVPWGIQTVAMDLEDLDSINRALEEIQPDVVIHCAAVRDEDRLEVDHEWGWKIMVGSTEVLARACQHMGAKLVFVSSCWVFGNRGEPPYAEDSPPCPANYFGLLKTVGETLVASLCDNFTIVRLPGVQGINWASSDLNLNQNEEGVGFGSLANYFRYRLLHGEPVVVWGEYFNQLDNPIVASDLADILLTIATQEQRGILHVCGRDSVSRLGLAQAVADVFGYDASLVRPASPEEMDVRRLAGKLTPPRDSRLQFARSEAMIGRSYPGLREGLTKFRRQLEEIEKK